MIQRITVLGATGSIGCNTLDVVRRHPGRYQVFALAADRNAALMAQQRCYQPVVPPPYSAAAPPWRMWRRMPTPIW